MSRLKTLTEHTSIGIFFDGVLLGAGLTLILQSIPLEGFHPAHKFLLISVGVSALLWRSILHLNEILAKEGSNRASELVNGVARYRSDRPFRYMGRSYSLYLTERHIILRRRRFRREDLVSLDIGGARRVLYEERGFLKKCGTVRIETEMQTIHLEGDCDEAKRLWKTLIVENGENDRNRL